MQEEQNNWTWKRRLLLLAGSMVIIFAVHFFIRYILFLVAPFLIAYLLALLIEKPVCRLAKLFGGRKTPAACMIVLVLTAVIGGGLALLCCLAFRELRLFFSNFDYICVLFRQKTAWVCFRADLLFGLTDGCCLDLMCKCADMVKSMFTGTGGAKMLGNVMKMSFPVLTKCIVSVGTFIICLISVVYLANALDKVRKWRKESIFREEIGAVTDSLKRLFQVYFKLQLVIMVINATICTAGLLFIKNPYAIVIGVLIGIVDALPFFGTGTVLIPWAVFALVCKKFMAAAVLLSVYVITYFVREIMESKCMGDRLGIAPFTMLVVIFSGIFLYGIFGFFLGPLAYCIAKALIIYFTNVVENAQGTW